MPTPSIASTGHSNVEALRVITRPALVRAYGRAVFALLVGVALVVSVCIGVPVSLLPGVIRAGSPATHPRCSAPRQLTTGFIASLQAP
jgi:cyanate permease